MYTNRERKQIIAIGKLVMTNPFSSERVSLEQEILGESGGSVYHVWHNQDGRLRVNTNLAPIFQLARQLVDKGIQFWSAGCGPQSFPDLSVWDNLVYYWLFETYRQPMCAQMHTQPRQSRYDVYEPFRRDYNRLLVEIPRSAPPAFSPEVIFAVCFQMHRAFYHIFDFIAGGSMAAGRLRSNIWLSIFTCNLERYVRQLRMQMKNMTTLITGESGTGKELVARAIALSQYIPFDSATCSFRQCYLDCFIPVQLSAMPQTMVESELFGYAKGAFTGAVSDHKGYLESCSEYGSIFLDEIGDVPGETQVKLLRVLQDRAFHPIGDVRAVSFQGKIIVATNMDLASASADGRFRKDLLFRLCADTLCTEPLRTLISGDENELRQFVIVLAQRILGEAQDVSAFVDESCQWIVAHLGVDYDWPGNVRELEQCLKNLLIRGDYAPMRPKNDSAPDTISQTAAQVMKSYLTAVFDREKSLAKTAAVAGLDRRTVKKYLDY